MPGDIKNKYSAKFLGAKKWCIMGPLRESEIKNSVGGKSCYVRGAPSVTMTTAYEQGANSDMHGGPAATQAMVKILKTSNAYPVVMHPVSISGIDDIYKA